MTKRDIIRFLEKKHYEMVKAANDEYCATINKIKEGTYSELGLPDLANKIQPLLAEALSLWEEWKKDNSDVDGLSFHTYYLYLECLLSDYTSSEAKMQTIADFIALIEVMNPDEFIEYAENLSEKS